MAAKSSNGIVLKMGATPTTIANVTKWSGPSGSATILDATSLASTFKEKLKGIPDAGQFTFDINYDYDSASHEALTDAYASDAAQAFELEFNGTDSISFSGFVMGFQPEGAVDAVITASVTIEITGAVTFPSVS